MPGQQPPGSHPAQVQDHPNLSRGPFLRDLAQLQHDNLARGICCTEITFGDREATLTLAPTAPGGAATVQVPLDGDHLPAALSAYGPWAPPAGAWFPLGIDPEPTDPLQIYTDLLYEIGDHAAFLHHWRTGDGRYPEVALILDRITLHPSATAPSSATIQTSTPGGTRYAAHVPLTDPAALIGIDMSISEWANAHPGARPGDDGFIHIGSRPDQLESSG